MRQEYCSTNILSPKTIDTEHFSPANFQVKQMRILHVEDPFSVEERAEKKADIRQKIFFM